MLALLELSGLHEELIQFARVALVQERLGRVLVQDGDWIFDLKKKVLKNEVTLMYKDF